MFRPEDTTAGEAGAALEPEAIPLQRRTPEPDRPAARPERPPTGIFDALASLRRRPVLLVCGVVVSLIIGLAVAYRPGGALLESRQHRLGVATASVLVDSQSSQVVAVGDGVRGKPTSDIVSLVSRARLLATLIGSSPLKERIAARVGVPAQQLITQVSAAGQAPVPRPVPPGTTISADDPDANVLSARTAETVPIIAFDVQAPSRDAAKALAGAAVTELRRYMRSVAVADQIPNARQLVVTPLGPAASATAVKGPGPGAAVIAFLLSLSIWCAGMLIVPAIVTAWRTPRPSAPPAPPS